MNNWPQQTTELTTLLRSLRGAAPDIMKAFAGIAQAATVSKALDGKNKDLTVVLGDRKELQKSDAQEEDPEDTESPNEAAPDAKKLNLEKAYGFTVEALTPANRHQYGIGADFKGVVVTFVSARSVAGEKGLRAGCVISAVGVKDIDGIAQFNQEIKKAGKKPLLLLVKLPGANGGSYTIAVPPK